MPWKIKEGEEKYIERESHEMVQIGPESRFKNVKMRSKVKNMTSVEIWSAQKIHSGGFNFCSGGSQQRVTLNTGKKTSLRLRLEICAGSSWMRK